MIKLEKVSKSYRARGSVKKILSDVTTAFVPGRNVGILGLNGSGKSTLLRLLAGSELPDKGQIIKNCRVSFPLAFEGTIHPDLSGRENVKFLARVYGADSNYISDFVTSFAELGSYFDMPTRTYSSGMRAKLAFGLCLAIDFDVYLIDEITAVGDATFQARCRAAFDERMRFSNIIMVSHSFETIRSYCDTGAILYNGILSVYDDVSFAIRDYQNLIGTAGLS